MQYVLLLSYFDHDLCELDDLDRSRRVSSDQGAPGPNGIGCPQSRGILDPFEVP